jgi:hypothetical protein
MKEVLQFHWYTSKVYLTSTEPKQTVSSTPGTARMMA